MGRALHPPARGFRCWLWHGRTLPGDNGEDNPTPLWPEKRESSSAAPGWSPWPFPMSRHLAMLGPRGRHGTPTRCGTQTLPRHLDPRHAAGLRLPAARASCSESQGSARPPCRQELSSGVSLAASQPMPGSLPVRAAGGRVCDAGQRGCELRGRLPPATSTFRDLRRHQSSTQYCYCAKWELYSLLWVFFFFFFYFFPNRLRRRL